jgi:ubiquitin-protein ligase
MFLGEIDRTVLLPATRRKEVRGIGIRAMKWLSAYFASEGLQPDTRRLLRWELLSETQDEDESVSSVTLCEGTTYTTTYDYYTGARIVIEIKEDFKVEWTIFTPMSLFYPGSHRGQLVFPKDFPFKPIKVRWESPIVSPYVNDYGNISTTGELENDWGPAPIHMDELMVNLAAILVYGPGFYGHVDAIQNAYKPWNWHMMSGSWNKMIPKSDSPFTETLPEDWVISVTNFFARNFNNDDEDSFEEPLTSIIPAQAEQSTVAIDACIDVLRADRKDKTLAELGDFKAAFGKIKTFGEWRREEKRCAEVLAFLAPGHPSG